MYVSTEYLCVCVFWKCAAALLYYCTPRVFLHIYATHFIPQDLLHNPFSFPQNSLYFIDKVVFFFKNNIHVLPKKKNSLKFERPAPPEGGKCCGIAKYLLLHWLSMLPVNLGPVSGFKTRLLVISVWQSGWNFDSDRCQCRTR